MQNFRTLASHLSLSHKYPALSGIFIAKYTLVQCNLYLQIPLVGRHLVTESCLGFDQTSPLISHDINYSTVPLVGRQLL